MSSLFKQQAAGAGWPLRAWRAVGAAGLACVLVAGCGGDDESDPQPLEQTAPAVDGAANEQRPIVAPPTQGCDVAPGDDAVRPPLLNTQLDCAP